MSARRGLQLPQTLRDEIEAKEKDERLGRGGRGGGGKRGQSLSRKDARKASRTEKKERKAGFFSQPRGKRANDDTAHPDAPPAKKAKLSDGKPAQARPAQAKPQPASAPAQPKPAPAPKPKEAAPTSKSSKAAGKTKLEVLVAATASKKRRARDEEDDKIAYLEAKLGLDKKRKKKTGAGYSSAFADDGLDDLLGDLDRIDDQLELGDDESDAELDADENASSQGDEDEDASDSDVAMDEEDEWQGVQDDAAGGDSASSQSEDDGDDDDDDGEAPQLIPVDEPSASQKPAAVSEASGRYVPPALRRQQLAESAPSEEALKLQRQLKGLLNRMSEQNIASVLADFEEAYRKHRRHDVTSTLTTLILDGIASHGAHLDSFVVLHAALVGALHRLVGIEFAAHFVQAAVARYDAAYSAPENDDERGKECANVLALLAALYALQVVACVLPYDLVRGLLAAPGAPAERDVELLLKLVRAAGPQMRADDPAALRDIVQLVQDKTEAEGAVGSRTKFMIETLVNLKNGKAKHGPDADGSAGAREVVERMKKFLSGLAKKRTVMAHEPLRVGLTDLREADKRGRWWLVGAAWAGDPLVEHQTSGTAAPKAEANTEQDALLALARKHGMNTDVRRSIFVVLMSSEDCVDAAARVAALGLNAVQQREVPRVALHCLGAERAYNPFWALVVQKSTTPAQKITLQFALWDFLRGMGEARVGGAEVVKGADAHADAFGGDAGAGKVGATKLENVARAYGWWIAKGACAITALKPLEFELLKPQTRRFVTRLLVHLFISTQVTSPAAPIAKATRKREEVERVMLFAARVPTLQQGLLYFLNSAFKKPVEGPEAQLVQWAVGVAKETLAAGVDIGALEEEWD